MTTAFINTVVQGAGPLHTFAAAGDELIVTETGMLLATTGAAISDLNLSDIELHIFGTVMSQSNLTFEGTGVNVHIYAGGTYTALQDGASSLGIGVSSTSVLVNEGNISGERVAAVVDRGGATILNYGSISGATAVFMGLFGSPGGQLVNGGTITANAYDDAGRDTRYNNGVLSEATGVHITNLATGQITAVATEGAGVRLNQTAGGTVIQNLGQITSMQDWGVTFATVFVGQTAATLFNRGAITGLDGSFQGSVNVDQVTNRGLLNGDVNMGNGNDVLDNRNGLIAGDVVLGSGDDSLDNRRGTIEGTVYGGDGNDTFFAGETDEIFDGGAGVDTLNLQKTAGGRVDLSGVTGGTGHALGDTYIGIESVLGSKSGADTIIGSAASNVFSGFGGADILDGGAGADRLAGGAGVDTLTGGAGNDTFQFNALTDAGDVILDFSAVAGNNDIFRISAAGFGGGLVAGALVAGQFRSRADNVAQDADDRFIFRTTDRTLWFDADGNGTEAALMVADLQAGAVVTAADIFLI